YEGLVASEARHFEQYITFVKTECDICADEIDARLEELKAIEAVLVSEPDPQFRFHSGVPL
ncbi:MAG: tRNA-(ms[2]io[6]A)-hydroxylase, partial [Gammaproteobacteria bacterium]|nr:tRNA-(ms[2]io[6]A)-hydroxylase [Gammaproteobacteria bacterium]